VIVVAAFTRNRIGPTPSSPAATRRTTVRTGSPPASIDTSPSGLCCGVRRTAYESGSGWYSGRKSRRAWKRA